MLFHAKQKRSVRFIQWVFLDLIVLFAAIATAKPAVGLAGIGTVLTISSLLILANKNYIWDSYIKHYKKPKQQYLAVLTEPTTLYRGLNVYVVWPLTLMLGLTAIYAAYLIG